MKNVRGKLEIGLAVFFLILGSFWFAQIAQRGFSFIPQSKPKKVESGSRPIIKRQVILTKAIERGLNQPAPVAKRKAVNYINYFRAICVTELFCSLFYLLTGFAFLRCYRQRYPINMLALATHLALYVQVFAYHYMHIKKLYPLSRINILYEHFTPDNEVFYQLIGYLTGVSFLKGENSLFFVPVIVYFLIMGVIISMRFKLD